MNSNVFHYSGFYTIVITETVKDIDEIVSSILNHCWSFHIVNVNILIYNGLRSETAVYTFFPYTETVCNKMIPELYDRYSLTEKRDIKNEVFADKLKNFHRCPVNIAIYAVPPCIVMKKELGKDYMYGIEGHILRVLAESLNFTLVIPDFNDSNKHYAVKIHNI